MIKDIQVKTLRSIHPLGSRRLRSDSSNHGDYSPRGASCDCDAPLDQRVAKINGGNPICRCLGGISHDVFMHGNGTRAAGDQVIDDVEAVKHDIPMLIHIAVEQMDGSVVDAQEGRR